MRAKCKLKAFLSSRNFDFFFLYWVIYAPILSLFACIFCCQKFGNFFPRGAITRELQALRMIFCVVNINITSWMSLKKEKFCNQCWEDAIFWTNMKKKVFQNFGKKFFFWKNRKISEFNLKTFFFRKFDFLR